MGGERGKAEHRARGRGAGAPLINVRAAAWRPRCAPGGDFSAPRPRTGLHPSRPEPSPAASAFLNRPLCLSLSPLAFTTGRGTTVGSSRLVCFSYIFQGSWRGAPARRSGCRRRRRSWRTARGPTAWSSAGTSTTRRCRRCVKPAARAAFYPKRRGVLAETVDRPPCHPSPPKEKKSNTSLRALQCSGTPPMAELGLEMCLLPPVSSDSFENDRKQRELSIRLHVSGRLAGGSLTPRPSLSFNRGRNPLTLPCPFFDIH